jgi:MarR family transcriptional regulator, multiple antibiotic resistance protein MarR
MDEIGLMGSVFFARRRRSAERLRAFGITLPQYYLIQLARRKGAISPSAAAAELSSDRPTATLVAKKCVDRGWLARKRSDGDRRSYRLELSGEGEELLDRIEAARLLSSSALGDPLDVLGSAEREVFRAALAKVQSRAKELFLS